MKYRGNFMAVTAFLLLITAPSQGQRSFLKSFSLEPASANTRGMPPGNSVSHIEVEDSIIFIGTGNGLAKSTDGGRSWLSFRDNPEFADDGIFSIAASGRTVWVSTGYNTVDGDNEIQTGSGYTYSTDGGETWTHVPQPLDTCIELPSSGGRRCRDYLTVRYGINDSVRITAVTTPVANVTFDISLMESTVWIASWSSGLRKSTDNGGSWEQILLPLDEVDGLKPTDTLWYFAANDTLHKDTLYKFFDVVKNDNLKAFSVLATSPDTVWCGTAGGVNRSTDGGLSWTKYNHRNRIQPILGDWVIAIREQKLGEGSRIWVTNWKGDPDADPNQEYGVSYTEDDGRTWKNLLHGVRAYDISFKDSIAYIATDDGLYRTPDGGRTFQRISNAMGSTGGQLTVSNSISVYDSVTRQAIATSQFLCIGVNGDTVIFGTSDGIARTTESAVSSFGSSWDIYRTYEQIGAAKRSYAYPNPFTPAHEVVRIHYGSESAALPGEERLVSIDIFDFGMNRVKTLLKNAPRSASSEFDELWDARNDKGDVVANGVYFYRIKIDDDEPIFGKILVLQ